MSSGMIALVNMPFASLTHPSLPLGQFKGQLAAAGLDGRVFNFNLDFARAIGYGAYETIAFFKGVETQVAEWLFAPAAWGANVGLSEDDFLDLCGEELAHIPKVADQRRWLRQIRHEVVPAYLEGCLARLTAGGAPPVVAFSCTFFQTISSLALGRLVKSRVPATKVVYGGACFHGEMGAELMEKVPWIDAVSTGEADTTILPLLTALRDGRHPAGLAAVRYRDEQGRVHAGPDHLPTPAAAIEALPDPDFDDFFADAARIGLDRVDGWEERLLLPFESARGCWWGEKHHCTFCGLNGQGMVYRKKGGAPVVAMLRRLADRYPQVRRFQAADNILDMGYFSDLVPALAREPLPDVELFYSIKSNLTRAQVRALAAAGIRYLQPGVESFSSHLLQLMDKGVTGLQNIFLLKCCRDYGITPFWNNLIRLPGEEQADYDRMAAWIPLIHHLRPPYGGAPKIECHRFSPYFDDAGRWTDGVRPQGWYAGLFPAERIDLRRVAYYFEADWRDVLGGGAYDALIAATHAWVDLWREAERLPDLRIEPRPDGGLNLVDSRLARQGVWQLDRVESAIYRAIDAPATPRHVARILRAAGHPTLEEAAIGACLDDFAAAGLALADDGRYLGLALLPTASEPSQTERRGLLKRRINNQRPGERLIDRAA